MDLLLTLDNICKEIGVSRIAEITGYEDQLIYVFQSVRPGSRHLIVDSGKGKTKEQALIACSVEAIERYSAENYLNKIFDVKISDIESSFSSQIINSLSPRSIKCLEGFDFYNPERKVFIPNDLIRYENNTSSEYYLRYFRSGTTGFGSHINKEKALGSCLMECLERDAIASKNSKFNVDLDTLPVQFKKYINWISKLTNKFNLIYHSSDFDINTFSTLSSDNEMKGGLMGMGCGYKLEDALENSLIESIQTWLMKVSGSRDDWCFADIYDSYPLSNFKKISWKELQKKQLQNKDSNNSDSDFEKIIFSLKSKNIKIYAVKIDPLINTNPIITYKVIIPSLNKLEQGNMFTGIFRSSENS